ncbi:uncharacterized protein IUM83_01295 [Phytophthora cinnamomi]|uniref:uncharacterized protein n=1 Tax=Phytophthora cinnamomi TaxID=4785 RepID=UPI0035595002|nr:hypothetical protein IUM83_01295 [Phytophthora cinnamomi]
MTLTLRLEESTPLAQESDVNVLNSDFILAQFLHEMDELDQQQTVFSQLDQESETMQADFFAPTAAPSDTQNKPRSAPAKRRSTSWLRRKQELHTLRQESKALETHLASLQLHRFQNACQQSSSALAEDQAMWKSVAAIAQQESRTSQNENTRLKHELQMVACAFEVMQAQLVVAESRKQQLLDSTAAFANSLRVGMVMSRRLCCDNGNVLDILVKRVNARFQELDSIVYETRGSMQQATTEQVQICRGSSHDAAIAVEFKHVRLLPFGEDATAKNVWHYIEDGGEAAKAGTRVVWSTPDMVGLESHYRLPLTDLASVTADVHTVIKKFAVAAGMVALVESRSEWSVQHTTSVVSRSTTEEGGWFVVHEYPLQQCGDTTQRASQLRTSLKLRPTENPIDGRPTDSCSLTSTITDVVIPSFRDILNSNFQLVENCLMDSTGN